MSNLNNLYNYNDFSTKEFEEQYYYGGDDLGAVWTKDFTRFRVWAPTATQVSLNLYDDGLLGEMIANTPMEQACNGTWVTTVNNDLHGIYYTYSVTVNGITQEAVDPYAKAVGVNGDRGMVIDLSSTNPEGFENETIPELKNSTDSIIYELHIRDFSIDKSSGMKHKGKYLAFTETGTTNSQGDKTGLDHLKDLGVTHIHLLPAFDYATVDETKLHDGIFNWGYDPKNYNVPEGSYSSDPNHGEVRIKEFKHMVHSLHKSGLRVILDVVYNHTWSAEESNFEKIVPSYYYRMICGESYCFCNASGCGNETASERAMMRKFIIDSVVYWAKEYHIDGFRFDLMGIHDITTMNEIREALNQIDPTILVYGEGWTGGASPLPYEEQALKTNITKLDLGIAAFSDDIRDGIKGSVFSSTDRGFVSGKEWLEETIKFGIVASTYHNQVDYHRTGSNSPWAKEPTQTITYASAHDNLTLWDKLTISNPEATMVDRIHMNLLSAAIVLTSQGIPFFQAGEEFLRSKPLDETGTMFEENSYKSPDSVNSLKWDQKTKYIDVYNYYKGLIAFRRSYPALRMTYSADIQNALHFIPTNIPNMIAYRINSSNQDTRESILIIFNANRHTKTLQIPEGEWRVYVKGMIAGTKVLETIYGGEIGVDAISTMVLVRDEKILD